MVQHSFLAIFHNSKIINSDNFTHFYQLSSKKIGKGKQLLNSARGHYFPNCDFHFFNFQILFSDLLVTILFLPISMFCFALLRPVKSTQ